MQAERDLAPGEWSCLALLANTPGHGWALAKEISRTGEVGRVWAVGRPLVYRALDLLERRGLIEQVGSEPGSRGPNRALFQATERGRAELARWLAEPVDHVRDVRSLFLLKLVLSERAGLDSRPLLRAQRAVTLPAVSALEARLAPERRHRARLRPLPARDDPLGRQLHRRDARRRPCRAARPGNAAGRAAPPELLARLLPARALERVSRAPGLDDAQPIVTSFQVAVPFGLVTVRSPVFAFAGTVTVSLTIDLGLKLAGTPWKVTDVVDPGSCRSPSASLRASPSPASPSRSRGRAPSGAGSRP